MAYFTQDRQVVEFPSRLDELLVEYEEDEEVRAPRLYSGHWVASYVLLFFATIFILSVFSVVFGGRKYAGQKDLAELDIAHCAGVGRYDSYDYEQIKRLGFSMRESKAGGVAEGGGIVPVGSEAFGTKGSYDGKAGEELRDNLLGGGVDLSDKKPEGRCGFEDYEPRGDEEGVRVITGTMADYGSLYKLLIASGISKNDMAGVMKAMGKVMNISKLRAEDKFRLYIRDSDGRFWFLEYQKSQTNIFHFLQLSDGGIDSHKVVFPTERRWAKAGGVVVGSLFSSVKRAGLDGSMANMFMDILGAYINFSEDTRKGDEFKVIASSQWIGKKFVSYDLPQALYYRGAKVGEITAILYPPDSKKPYYYKPDGFSLKRIVCDVPMKRLNITSGFNPRRFHPILKTIKPHLGVDFGAPIGTPVYAYSDGVVKEARMAGAMGNMIHIVHGGGVETYYGHLHGFAKGIKSGVKVRRGQLIGYVGNTGRSTGPHLHFGMKRKGVFVDPMKYLKVRTTKEAMIARPLRDGFFNRARTMLALLDSIKVTASQKVAQKAGSNLKRIPASDEKKTGGASAIEEKHNQRKKTTGDGRWDSAWR